jgi:hypothetical protein
MTDLLSHGKEKPQTPPRADSLHLTEVVTHFFGGISRSKWGSVVGIICTSSSFRHVCRMRFKGRKKFGDSRSTNVLRQESTLNDLDSEKRKTKVIKWRTTRNVKVPTKVWTLASRDKYFDSYPKNHHRTSIHVF